MLPTLPLTGKTFAPVGRKPRPMREEQTMREQIVFDDAWDDPVQPIIASETASREMDAGEGESVDSLVLAFQ